MAVSVIDFADNRGQRSERRLADLPDRVVAGDPQHVTTMHYDKGVQAGTWTSTPGKWHAFTGRDEFCYLVSGHVELIGSDGTVQSFRTGDAFLIPEGFTGYWHVIETTTKHFVIRNYSPD